ncbi:MAG: glycosidase, partial [Spirochaetia bacterium]|nr:glycosidase [Spirochaetia bacterium]
MNLTRTGLVLRPDPARVIFRPLHPGNPERVARILSRIAGLSDSEVAAALAGVLEEFGGRHKRLHDFFLSRFEFVRSSVANAASLSVERKLLTGAYFSQEYSLEAAALFNPSIIPHPDQSALPGGHLRFILSLRATGEGHLSSITFRTGQVAPDGTVLIDTPTTFVSSPEHMTTMHCEKEAFRKRLLGQGADEKVTEDILAKLPQPFELKDLRREIDLFYRNHPLGLAGLDHASGRMLAIASAHYEIWYTPGHPLSERVLFPTSPDEAAGIEDARFVKFKNDDGSFTYFATYTAYDGRSIHPQILETRDFLRFRVNMLSG